IDIKQAAAYREITRVEYLGHVPVTSRLQSPLFRIQVQPLADLHVKAAADNVTQWRKALQQGLHRYYHDAALQFWQPVQGRQALADDFRVRAEVIVRQGFPVGKVQYRQRRRRL